MQSGYIRFKKVFSAARLAKYFGAGNTDFATLEETMKFIYRTAKDPARRLISDILDVKDVNQNAKFKGMVDNSHTALQRLENILTEYKLGVLTVTFPKLKEEKKVKFDKVDIEEREDNFLTSAKKIVFSFLAGENETPNAPSPAL